MNASLSTSSPSWPGAADPMMQFDFYPSNEQLSYLLIIAYIAHTICLHTSCVTSCVVSVASWSLHPFSHFSSSTYVTILCVFLLQSVRGVAFSTASVMFSAFSLFRSRELKPPTSSASAARNPPLSALSLRSDGVRCCGLPILHCVHLFRQQREERCVCFCASLSVCAVQRVRRQTAAGKWLPQ